MAKLLEVTTRELNLESIIRYGTQCLRFDIIEEELADEDEEVKISFQGIAYNRVWQIERVNNHRISYTVLGRFSGSSDESEDEAVLRKFLQLDVNLPEFYADWSQNETFKRIFDENPSKLEGIRILKPDLLEAFVKCIIQKQGMEPRARKMLEVFCKLYGEPLEIELDNVLVVFYNFPTYEKILEKLPEMDADLLRQGYGFHNKYAGQHLRTLEELGGLEWLAHQGERGPRKAYKRLLANFHALGEPTAINICNSAFGMTRYVPLTRHIYNVVSVHYLPHLPRRKVKGSNKDFDTQIKKFFRLTFPRHAAWAAQVLLASNEIKVQQILKTPARCVKSRRYDVYDAPVKR